VSDTWGDDERTNIAIEHLHLMSAKTDKDGRVVPRHRYTRREEHLIGFLGTLAWAPRYQRFCLTQDRQGAQTTVTAEISARPGSRRARHRPTRVCTRGRRWRSVGRCSTTPTTTASR
jgi:hypothetical protein